MIALQKKLDAPTLLLLGGIVFWIAFTGFAGPSGMDFELRDAGVNFALGKGFVEIANRGNPTLEYKYYAIYPPVYVFLYGLFLSVFGVGPYQHAFFDLLLQIVKSILLFSLVIYRYGVEWSMRKKILTTLLIVLYLPTTYTRPEEISTILFLLSIHYCAMKKYPLAFLILGLSLMTAPFLGGISFLLLLILYFVDVFLENPSKEKKIKELFPVLYVLIIPILIVSILAYIDFGILERFYFNVKSLAASGAETLEYILGVGNYYGKSDLFSLILVLFFGIFLSFEAYRKAEKKIAFLILLATAIVGFLNFKVKQYYYMQHSCIPLLIMLFVLISRRPELRKTRDLSFLVCFGLLVLITVPRTVRGLYLHTFPMSKDKYEDAKMQVQNFFKDRTDVYKPNVYVMVPSTYYFMIKELTPNVLSAGPRYNPDEPINAGKDVRYVIEPPGKDSVIAVKPDPLMALYPKSDKIFLYRKVFETEKSVPNPQNTFWERLLMRPHETWYPVIYERIDEQ